MKLLIFILFCGSWISSFAASDTIRPFTSDGCSLWANGSLIKPDLWKSCCFEHDVAYWMGGTKAERELADQTLKACVNEKENPMGEVMYIGVKIGGSPDHKTWFRWGYGWPISRGYAELTTPEREMITEEIGRSTFNDEEKDLVEKVMVTRGLLPADPP